MSEVRIKKIEQDIRSIKENHLAHIEKDLSELKVNSAINTNDLSWLKENHWRVTVGVGMAIITTIIGIIINYITI